MEKEEGIDNVEGGREEKAWMIHTAHAAVAEVAMSWSI